MDMSNDEIVVRYRQAKHKGEQLNILADLNACSVDDIVQVLVEHGGYKLDRMSRSRGKARILKEEEGTAGKELIKPVKKPEKIPPVVTRAINAGYAYLGSQIDARRDRIEELEAEIAEFEKDIAALKAWEEEHK